MNLLIMLAALVLSLMVAQHRRPALNRVGLIGLVALGLLAPFISNNLAMLTGVYVAGTAAIGWNIIGGFTGYAAFGQSAFFGLGGYTLAVMIGRAQQRKCVAHLSLHDGANRIHRSSRRIQSCYQ